MGQTAPVCCVYASLPCCHSGSNPPPASMQRCMYLPVIPFTVATVQGLEDTVVESATNW